MSLFLAATLIVLFVGTSQATFQVTNDVLDVSFEEDHSSSWYYQYHPGDWIDNCYQEHFGVSTWDWSATVASDGDFAVTQPFQVSPDGRTATAKLGYDHLDVTRRIHLDPGDVKQFTITYTLENVGPDPLTDVRFFEMVDYDVAGSENDYGVYDPGADLVWVNDDNYYKCGFSGSIPSSHHGVGSSGGIYNDWLDGTLNDMNRYPAVGTGDAGVGLQWNVGNLGVGDTWEITITFIVQSTGTPQETFHVTNDVLDVRFEEDYSFLWEYQYQPGDWADCCSHEHFGVSTQDWTETVASDGSGTINSFAVTQPFQFNPNGRTATVRLGYDGLDVTRRVHLDPGGAKQFTITYTLKNVGPDPLTDVRFFQMVDYDVGGSDNDYGVYEPGADSVWVNDDNYYKSGFVGSIPSSHHGVGDWYDEVYDDWDDGTLNDQNRYPAAGTGDPGVGLQWNIGNLGVGDTWEITITFFFGESPVTGAIGGMKFNDLNGDGVKDANEPGLQDWTINLEQPAGNVIATRTTDFGGEYIFSDLDPGDYVVSEVQDPSWIQTYPPAPGTHPVTIDNFSVNGVDFGNRFNEGPLIRVKKTADRDSATPGEEINYTIEISNVGNAPATNVVVEDVFNRDVDIVSVSPPPDDDGRWHLGTLNPGPTVIITLAVKTVKQDFDFSMDQAVKGDGFVNAANDYNTAPPSYVLTNCVYVTYNTSSGNRETVSDCESVAVGEAGTELSTREHGSGLYDSEETLKLLTENKSIEMNKDVSATYAPTTLGLYNNRTVAFSSKWTEEARAKNRITGTSMSESYRYATAIDRESEIFLDENESVMDIDSTFDGMGHFGFLKMPSSSSNQTTPLFEATEDYSGSFKVVEKVDEYGSGVSSEKAASGSGLVVVDKRVGDSQKSYESGTGSYDSEELIETYTNYIAKDISLVHSPMSQRLTDDVSINSSMKWKEGMYSRVANTSFIGEEYTSITELDKETVAKGLNEMDTIANFSGQARYRAILRDEVDFDETYAGDYSVERNILFTGVSKYDRPHLNVTKTLEGIVEETEPWGYNETHLAGEVKKSKVATYTITIENDGNAALGPIYVKDFFPPGAIFKEPSSLRPTELTETSANWTLTHLAIGDVVEITLELDVTKYYPYEIVNRVEVCGGYNGDWICASNFTALEKNWLTCCLNETVSATKTARLDDANSSLVWYTVEIRNNDNVTRAATVTDRLPAGMELVSSLVPFASYEEGVVVWNLVEIGPFETATIEFSALAPGDGRFLNTVEVEAQSVDGPVVGPVYASCVIDVGIVEDECGAISCGIWQPPNWDFEHRGYEPDELTCEQTTCTGCDGTESCIAP